VGSCLRAMSQAMAQNNPDTPLVDSDVWATQTRGRPVDGAEGLREKG
jgi:hypothetical protein